MIRDFSDGRNRLQNGDYYEKKFHTTYFCCKYIVLLSVIRRMQSEFGEETSSATTASTSPSETVAALPADVSPDSESSAIESTSEDTRALTLSVVNMCGIEVGMVAVIDPVTGEQVNLDSLSDQESISMEADWPSSVNEFQWALYNTDGELCVEGTTDISSAQATVTLLLTGDGDLEKVEELFE